MKKKPFLKTIAYIAAAVFVIGCLVWNDATALRRYQAYEGETTGIVENVDSYETYSSYRKMGDRWRTKKRTTYSYLVDGREYRASTDGGVRIGSEIVVKFDPADPSDHMTELEKPDAIGMWVFPVEAVGIVAAVIWFDKKAMRTRS